MNNQTNTTTKNQSGETIVDKVLNVGDEVSASGDNKEILEMIMQYFDAIDFKLHKHPRRSVISEHLNHLEKSANGEAALSKEEIREDIHNTVKKVVASKVLEILYKVTERELYTTDEVFELFLLDKWLFRECLDVCEYIEYVRQDGTDYIRAEEVEHIARYSQLRGL